LRAEHDSEVGCKGFCFGASQSQDFNSDEELRIWNSMENVYNEMVPKKTICKTTCYKWCSSACLFYALEYKEQTELTTWQKTIDVREYNHLVESNFKTKHQVADYAKCWIKSQNAIEFIQEIQRKITFAGYSKPHHSRGRRLLRYSDKSIKEIAYEIGYEGHPIFQSVFKKLRDVPSDFKDN
jgi:YesN/AraC family two-component response regulator